MQSPNGSSPSQHSKNAPGNDSAPPPNQVSQHRESSDWGVKERNLAARIGRGLAARSRSSQQDNGQGSDHGGDQVSDQDNGAASNGSNPQDTQGTPPPPRRAIASNTQEMVLTNQALLIQQDLLTTWVRTVRMGAGTLMIKALLQQILEICQECVKAEQGSLFLLDDSGAVSECLLARGATIREQKRAIVGRILDDGLAAWVTEHRKIGWIQDAVDDERWVVLPNQPYTVRSALCLPLQRGNRILGLVTLTHKSPHHFTEGGVRLMEKVSDAIALVLENAQLYADHTTPTLQPREVLLPSTDMGPQTSARALYITTADGKLRYVNRKFASLFGYRRRDIAKMESILDLIPVDYQDQLVQQMQRCIEQDDTPVDCQISGRHRDGHLLRLSFYAERIHFARRPGTLGVVHRIPPPGQDTNYQPSDESDILSMYDLSDAASHFSDVSSEFVIDTDFDGRITSAGS